MRVATYNIHRGWGAVGWYRPDRILDVVAELRADVVALQEAQHWLRPGVDMLDGHAMGEVLGLRPLAVAEQPAHLGWRGNVLLVAQHARVLRAPVGLRLGGAEPRGAILVELDLGEGPFRLLATHLSLGSERRRRQARLLLQAMQAGVGPALPTLLLGDLNERREDGGALEVLRPVFGAPPRAPTFPAFRPWLSFDRILGDRTGLVSAVRAHDTPLARRASDHLPLVAEVDLGARRPVLLD
ncbi:EEP domain-containing protein [Falsiroseomonas bella]|uniref:EEP domain-containing protein n=1 Tax=Falsiroseomonas bella TaxID=2184016 RepID=A0A317FF45_9PROT|nr:endonuclease/exonuclease/phosphatase family protein [Falsiroseomonas bella]PWS36637.1 EEP domain-containing protein [Falsiroseomonas bella]